MVEINPITKQSHKHIKLNLINFCSEGSQGHQKLRGDFIILSENYCSNHVFNWRNGRGRILDDVRVLILVLRVILELTVYQRWEATQSR